MAKKEAARLPERLTNSLVRIFPPSVPVNLGFFAQRLNTRHPSQHLSIALCAQQLCWAFDTGSGRWTEAFFDDIGFLGGLEVANQTLLLDRHGWLPFFHEFLPTDEFHVMQEGCQTPGCALSRTGR